MKVHPLLRILVTQPHLLADHAASYGSLLEEEATKFASSWLGKVALFAASGIVGVLAVFFGGTALMLRGVLPPENYPAGWLLWAVPAGSLVLAGLLALLAVKKPTEQPLSALKAQLSADLAMLHEATEPAPLTTAAGAPR